MIVICIPAYKNQLEWYEKVSLNQAFSVFYGKYDICFCVPESIKDYYSKMYRNKAKVVSFKDEYFTSVKAYSELCLSVDFYKCFEQYDYMLLYQLDAFVFCDNLERFCALNFDYIGADTCDGKDWNLINGSIGCGGLSLRKISSAIRILKDYGKLLSSHPLRGLFNSKEDVFWGYCGHKETIDFRIPNIELANEFAVTFGADYLIDRNDIASFPFGTHAWFRYDYDLWKNIIEEYGYELPEIQDVEYQKTNVVYLKTIRYRKALESIRNNNASIDKNKSYSIWGAGYNGIRCIRILNLLGIQIDHIYDWNINALNDVEDIIAPLIENPTVENLDLYPSEKYIIVTTYPDNEITGKLKCRKYVLFDDFLDKIVDKTLER